MIEWVYSNKGASGKFNTMSNGEITTSVIKSVGGMHYKAYIGKCLIGHYSSKQEAITATEDYCNSMTST